MEGKGIWCKTHFQKLPRVGRMASCSVYSLVYPFVTLCKVPIRNDKIYLTKEIVFLFSVLDKEGILALLNVYPNAAITQWLCL